MIGVTMATVRTILMIWTSIDDSKEDDEFDWTMPVVGCVIYVVFGGTYEYIAKDATQQMESN